MSSEYTKVKRRGFAANNSNYHHPSRMTPPKMTISLSERFGALSRDKTPARPRGDEKGRREKVDPHHGKSRASGQRSTKSSRRYDNPDKEVNDLSKHTLSNVKDKPQVGINDKPQVGPHLTTEHKVRSRPNEHHVKYMSKSASYKSSQYRNSSQAA